MTWLKATRNLPRFCPCCVSVRFLFIYAFSFYSLLQLDAKVFKEIHSFKEMFTLVLFCSLVQKLSVSIRTTCRCKDEEQVFVNSLKSILFPPKS